MRDRTLGVLLVVAYGWLFVFFEGVNNPNELVRVYAARSLAEGRGFAIGRRVAGPRGFRDEGPLVAEWGWINDRALVCDDPRAQPPACAGTLLAAKAPGPSLLGAPVLSALRAIPGAVHSRAACVLALRWTLAILPTLALWLAVRRFLRARGVADDTALAVVLAAALGSLSFTYGQMFAGHQLAACALGGAFLCAFWPGERSRGAWLGLLAGSSPLLEYPTAPAAFLVGLGWLWFRRPPSRAIAAAILAALVPLSVLAAAHTAQFGAPWRTPYSFLENPQFARDIAPGVLGISLPTWERVSGSLWLPETGLLFWAPWIALAPLGFRRRRDPAVATALAALAYLLVFQVTHALWRGGWVIGPRYITAAVPFAAVAVGLSVRPGRERALLGGLAAAAVCATGLASAVCQGFPFEVHNGLREVVWPLLAHGFVPRNPLQLLGVPGLWSALPFFAALAVALGLLLRRTALAWAVALAVALAQWLTPPSSTPLLAAHFLESVWNPNPPPGATRF